MGYKQVIINQCIKCADKDTAYHGRKQAWGRSQGAEGQEGFLEEAMHELDHRNGRRQPCSGESVFLTTRTAAHPAAAAGDSGEGTQHGFREKTPMRNSTS